VITFDETEPLEPPRGLRGCPRCHRFSLIRKETEHHHVFAQRGAVAATRTFVCTTVGCDTVIRFLDVSVGEASKGSVRSYGAHYGEPSAVAVETDAQRIVLKT
jgi:hypothetical protein